MIKLKEIPIGDLTAELFAKQHVYCKRRNSALYRVIDNTEMPLKDIEKLKFYIEDNSEEEDIYKQFANQIVSDYGPIEGFLGRMIHIHVDSKGSLQITYNPNPLTNSEDTSEGESEITWGEIFKEFTKQHIALKPLIDDYRPSDKPFTIRIWTKAPFNIEFEVTYQPDINMFVWRR